MSRARLENPVASIRQRLLTLAKARNEEFQFVLDRFAVERLLYRLSVSQHRDQFLLKGAMLFALWFDAPHRPTRDADFLGFGPPEPTWLADIVRSLCAIEGNDGIEFDAASLKVVGIREEARYDGLRATLVARLGNARCQVQWDVGFGDAVTPAPESIVYPPLLADLQAPRLRVYPRESVFAEKIEAIAQLGIANSRMKDYFDLHALVREDAMSKATLNTALIATFERRGTLLPAPVPFGLTDAFANDPEKQRQWNAFRMRNRLLAPGLPETVDVISAYYRDVRSGMR